MCLPLRLLAGLLGHVWAAATSTAEVPSQELVQEGSGQPVLTLHMYTRLCVSGECRSSGASLSPAVQMMVNHINNGSYLRGNWTLDVKLFDFECSEEMGREQAGRLLLLPRKEWPFAVVGCGCNGCTTSVAPLLNLARVPLISHGSTNPSFSNRTQYPNFFRLSTPDSVGPRAQLLTFRALNWTIHAQVYEANSGELSLPFARQLADDLGMVNVLAGRNSAKMSPDSLASAQRVVEALVLVKTRAVMYLGSYTGLWYVGCAIFQRNIHGMIVAYSGGSRPSWKRPPSTACAPAEMDIAVNYWIATKEDVARIDGDAEAECFPSGVTRKAFMREYKSRVRELGLPSSKWSKPGVDAICLLAKTFNTLLGMGFEAGEVHNMNKSTYATYSTVVQGTSMIGMTGLVSFPDDPTAFGAGDNINIELTVVQVQNFSYVEVAKTDGHDASFEGTEAQMSFFGNRSLAQTPAALFPACRFGIYNFLTELCEGCPVGSDFIETQGKCFCSPGFRVNGTECSPCAEGSYSASFGAQTCEFCDKGMFAQSPGQTSCERCPRGTFMPRVGGTACVPCGPSRTTLARGAEDAALCVCKEGNFFRNDTATCEVCSEGLLCPAGLSPPGQLPGFWAELRELTRELVVWRCRSIRECIGGAVGECAAGRQGRSCHNCVSSHRPFEDGTCKHCDSWDLVPGTITGIAVVALLIGLLVLVRVDVNKENVELVGITIVATQLCMVLQMLGVFVHIQVPWVNPAKDLMKQLQFLLLDLDVIYADCWLPFNAPVSKFAFRLLAFPFWVCVVLLAWGASQFTSKRLSSTDVFSLLGTLLFMVFIMLTLSVLLPFQCQSNPSGQLSMVDNPGVVCFESTEHWTLVVMAVVGFAMYPATCLAWASWATLNYPSWISSGCGLHMVQKYRFLFGRYKPEHYYCGLCMLLRNGFIALLPIAFVSMEAAQIIILCVLLVCSAIFVAQAWPWRTHLANCADVLMLFSTTIFLTGTAMLVRPTEETQLSFGWLLLVLMVLPLALGLVFIASGIWRNIHRRFRYEVFLSHHKAGAGVLARFLKLELAKAGVRNTFLDVDSLENLDSLFHIVRKETRNMVVLLTSETLKRRWCAGEIVAAHRNKVHTVPVLCDGFKHPDESALRAISDLWNAVEVEALGALGISWDMARLAYIWLQQLPCVELRHVSSQEEHSQNVRCIIDLCSRVKSAPQPKPRAVSRPEFLVTGAVSDAKALVACQVFQIMLQQATQAEVAVVRTPIELERGQGTASFLVVLLTRGVLLDEQFADILLAANKSSRRSAQVRKSWTRRSASSSGSSLTFVTVNADAGFEFPSTHFYEHLRWNGLGGNDAESLISSYQSLLRILALPFSPLGSVKVLQNEVSEICRRRFGRCDFNRSMSSKDSDALSECDVQKEHSSCVLSKDSVDMVARESTCPTNYRPYLDNVVRILI